MQRLFSRSEQTKKWQDSRPRTGHCDVLPDSTAFITNHCGKKGGLDRTRTFYIAAFRRRSLPCDHQSARCLHSAAPIAAATDSKILKWRPTYAIRKVEATHYWILLQR